MTVVLLDLDGVLYQGDKPVPGAAETLAWLKRQGIAHLFLTNTTSRPRTALVDKLASLGIAAESDRILTPAVAAVDWLRRHVSGPVALFVPAATRAEFAELEILPATAGSGAAAVVVGDLGPGWDFATLNRAFRLLMSDPPPALVALGMTRYWRAADGLRLDTGPFVAALEQATGIDPVVTGKPAAGFFQSALGIMSTEPGHAIMVGDDIRGDIQGAQAVGLRTILVRTGKFRPGDLETGVKPEAVLDSIADLPVWWEKQA